MTNTTVKGVSPYVPKASGKTASAKESKDAFQDYFSQLCNPNGNQLNQVDQLAEKTMTAKTGKEEPRKNDNAVKDTVKQPNAKDSTTKLEEKEPVDDLEEEDTLSEQVSAASDKLIAEIAAQFGVSAEQIAETMEQLAIKPEELFDADSLKELLVAIGGNGEEASLLTDETLYQSVKDLMATSEQMFAELAEQTGMSEEELKSYLSKLAEKGTEQVKEPEVLETIGELTGQAVEPQNSQYLGGIEVKQADHVTQHFEATTVQENQSSQTAKQDESPEHSSKKEQDGENHNSFLQQTGQVNGALDTEAMITEQASMPEADTEQIMRQILDYMRVQVKADMTQMEIQLHPASLGNIHIQLTAQNGQITAQFTAQNEAVKNALESQIVPLKEALSEQGVKVEAVEVTIASHEFERNLEQNQSQNEQNEAQAATQRAGKRRRSNLSLNDLSGVEAEEEIFDGMDEADRITADMMRRNGNSIDFSA